MVETLTQIATWITPTKLKKFHSQMILVAITGPLNFTRKNTSIITRSSSYNFSKSSFDHNYYSFIVFFNVESSSSKTIQELRITDTNVGEKQMIYVANPIPIKRFDVNVTPNK
ncbi:hypothetical protein MTR_8g027670 [Medicago truncatula]|uniref:Uncharacterized protein n=1 Tax=Medicago truncatula TaxID=3880 RepID=G8A2X9_MEDTR|nr:hypothetical protein MTR_8g027670 [Medicago truncatula]